MGITTRKNSLIYTLLYSSNTASTGSIKNNQLSTDHLNYIKSMTSIDLSDSYIHRSSNEGWIASAMEDLNCLSEMKIDYTVSITESDRLNSKRNFKSLLANCVFSLKNRFSPKDDSSAFTQQECFSSTFERFFSTPKKMQEGFKKRKLISVQEYDLPKYCEFAIEIYKELIHLMIAYARKEIEIDEKMRRDQKPLIANELWYLGYTAPIELGGHPAKKSASEEELEDGTVKKVRFS